MGRRTWSPPSPWDPMELPLEIQRRHICPAALELTDSVAIQRHRELDRDAETELNIVLDGTEGFKGVQSGDEKILCYVNRSPARAIFTKKIPGRYGRDPTFVVEGRFEYFEASFHLETKEFLPGQSTVSSETTVEFFWAEKRKSEGRGVVLRGRGRYDYLGDAMRWKSIQSGWEAASWERWAQTLKWRLVAAMVPIILIMYYINHKWAKQLQREN